MKRFLLLSILSKIQSSKRRPFDAEQYQMSKYIRIQGNEGLNSKFSRVEETKPTFNFDLLQPSTTYQQRSNTYQQRSNTYQQRSTESALNIGELPHLPAFNVPNPSFDDLFFAKEMDEYRLRANYLFFASRLNACIVSDDVTMIGEDTIGKDCKRYIYVKAEAHIIHRYHNPDPIEESIRTVKYILNSKAFNLFLNLINQKLKFECQYELLDKSTIEQYLNDVKPADFLLTDFNVALEALTTLNNGALTKHIASKNIAKLIIFASRSDIKFNAILANLMVKTLKKLGQYSRLEDEIKQNSTLTLIHIKTKSHGAGLKRFSGLFTTFKAKIAIILFSIYFSTKYCFLPFSN